MRFGQSVVVSEPNTRPKTWFRVWKPNTNWLEELDQHWVHVEVHKSQGPVLVGFGVHKKKHAYYVHEDSYWETFLRGGFINHSVTLFLWRAEYSQKRARSTGNHTERLWKKNLDQKFDLKKKLEHFSEKKVPSPPIRNLILLKDFQLNEHANISKTWIFRIFRIFGGTFTAPTGGTVGVSRCH